jgi:hypothetical protein
LGVERPAISDRNDMSATGCDDIALIPSHRGQDSAGFCEGGTVAPDFLTLRHVAEVTRVPALMFDDDPFVGLIHYANGPIRRIVSPSKRRIGELARLIDDLSGEMGVTAFREAIRKHGYDVDANTGMLARRGVNVN